ncbi:MAG: DUF6511 domain-containing protein [Rhodocyclaceae bacterium]|nr:DUF6511 domain-containing protein [Rhodocyclaceae bacterium]
MKCWVCTRQARGFGYTDNQHGVGNPRRYPIDWVFCSQRCQNIFHAMYGNWRKAKDEPGKCREVVMIDPSDIEIASMKKCLKSFGEAAGEIGFTKPLGDYSEAEALRVIDAIVTRYTEAMVEHHEATKFPPVRGMPPTPDPLASPFADLEDDLPWETKS